MTEVEITPDEARRYLLHHHGLATPPPSGRAHVRPVFEALGAVQLDPLAPMGDNASLVFHARVRGLKNGDVYGALLPGAAFEHFGKERCLLPARAFPHYRDQAKKTPAWRLTKQLERVPVEALEAVYAEVAERGPVTAADLRDRGRVRPIDWSGWKSTSRMSTMALEVLTLRCRLVVSGRTPGGKIYDLPSRALPDHHALPSEPFARWALLERVRQAGLLSRAGSPMWSMIREARTSSLPDDLVSQGVLEAVRIRGSRRPYLAMAGFRERIGRGHRGDRVRVLAPLDPLIWDRKLVRHVFGFEYVWEVYKPARQRRWGWYVCPLLFRGQLVGRLEARTRDGALWVDGLWMEPGLAVPERALAAVLRRHARACGVEEHRWTAGARRQLSS
ncbi:MAG: crosslink repair DNA glycosylase YcaQ family protein [Sandaracinaceae bacterium]